MATMKITLPGASANTGVKASALVPEGSYELNILVATWDDSQFVAKEQYTLKLEGTLVNAPDEKMIGRKHTRFLNLRTAEGLEDWMKEGDITAVRSVFDAAGLKIVKDVLPVEKLVGKIIGFDIFHKANRNDDTKIYANVTDKLYYAVAEE